MSKMPRVKKKSILFLSFSLGAAIVIGTILYTNYIINRLAKAENTVSELMVDVVRKLPEGNKYNFELFLNLQKNNENLGIILTDGEHEIIDVMNWEGMEYKNNKAFFDEKLEEIKSHTQPTEVVPVDGADNNMYKNYIYVHNSSPTESLKWFPYLQFIVGGIFFTVVLVAMRFRKQAEQERLWVGMAKETAHQLGTPVSSLIGWIENIRVMYTEDETLEMFADEMQKDIDRLCMVANRFSKIGTSPELRPVDIYANLTYHLKYIRQRAPRKVTFDFPKIAQHNPLFISIHENLFNWVIENLLKNALDAMGGRGQIGAKVSATAKKVMIDVWDTGKGMPKSNFKQVFQPGFSTKKRGWGLGLSLCRRIIENYHRGRIFVLKSVIGQGTTFRIELPRKLYSNSPNASK